MLSSAIKSLLLYLTRKAILQDEKFWKEGGTLFFFMAIFTNVLYKVYNWNISGTVTDPVKFYP